MHNCVLIVGATSGIARETAHEFARRGHPLLLAARNLEELRLTAADIRLRHGVEIEIRPFDAMDFASHRTLFEGVELDGVIVCHGYLGEQSRAQTDMAEAAAIIEVNFTSYVSVLHTAAEYFEQRRKGFICALSSVAGDRGRQSNYVYGAAKGALSILLQGLRNRLHPAGVRVITAKPGFVDTGMTFGLLGGGPLVASPEQVARGLCRAIAAGKHTIYLPGFWRWIMLVIRSIPEPLFKRLRL